MKNKELQEQLSRFPSEMPVQIELENGETIDEVLVDAGNGYVIISEFK